MLKIVGFKDHKQCGPCLPNAKMKTAPAANRETFCPICREEVLPAVETGWLHVHYAEDILSAERLAELKNCWRISEK